MDKFPCKKVSKQSDKSPYEMEVGPDLDMVQPEDGSEDGEDIRKSIKSKLHLNNPWSDKPI